MCCEVLLQYMYVLRAYLTVKTYVLRGVLERQTPSPPEPVEGGSPHTVV